MGYMNPGRWRHIEDTFQEQGLLSAPIDLKPFIYDPNPKPDMRFLYGLLTVLALIAGGRRFLAVSSPVPGTQAGDWKLIGAF